MENHRPRLFAVVPTLLTLANAACGFGAITYVAHVGPDVLGSQHLYVAGWLIFAAMLFDVFDGQVARWTRQTSDFGAQLDSFCDLISFGVAPPIMMLAFCDQYQGRVLWVIALLFMLCTILRLARFNVETDEEDAHDVFTGLPSPAAAGTIAAFAVARPALYRLAEWQAGGWIQWLGERAASATTAFLPLLTLLLACLMASRIRYPHVANHLFRGRRPYRHVLQLIFAGMVVFLVREIAVLAVPLVFCCFALAPPLRAGWQKAAAHLTRRSP
ncbi:MAG TPA: CDP-diacylglycerol--serine O-phosphatidyltransferase [Thermoguttaceae bacterium]|nr:CDP-diacylglycerol--serine O-phosphatidyltransferase [Thermoguttaceae bacterium]